MKPSTKGIRLATGEIIGLVHSDDVLYDEHTISDVSQEGRRRQMLNFYMQMVYIIMIMVSR